MKSRVMAALAALRELDPPAAGKGTKGYQHTYPHYAKLYGKSERTIIRWAAEGKPLDDPSAMAELLSPRGRKPDEPALDNAPAPDPFAETSPVKLDESFFRGAGVLAAVERLKAAERERAAAYFHATSNGHGTAAVQNRFKEWMGIVEALRKLALDEPAIRKANELTVDKTEMEASAGKVFAAFRTAARSLPTRATAKLLAVRTREEMVEILDGEVDVLLRTLAELAAGAADEEADRLQAGEAAEEAPPLPPPPPVENGSPQPSSPRKKSKPAKKTRRTKGGKAKC